ncbi:uncharacterized protein LOC119088483 [Peromyscus leucopus]|uniref:uncharacterized protein LOC119088483 n=1 Tax=Peromyscus leucopus TaxID=10041 RepID=UPI001885475F|nr:uncharacterized protein LOC119088483 [Peromyscus leucopus]
MLSRLRGLFDRGNGQHGETRVRQKEACPGSPWKIWRKWSWGRGSEFWDGSGELSVCGELQLSTARAQELGTWSGTENSKFKSEMKQQPDLSVSGDTGRVGSFTLCYSSSNNSCKGMQQKQLQQSLEPLERKPKHEKQKQKKQEQQQQMWKWKQRPVFIGSFSPGAMPYHRLNSFWMLKKEHKQVMLDLQKMPMEISDGVNKVKQLIEENVSYRYMPDLS